jgi:prepilin-type N-terminal cleavage/methylation domain-containing protein
MKLKKRMAFTLIELLVTLTIFSFAMLAIMGIMNLGLSTLERYTKQSDIQLPIYLFSKITEGILAGSYNIKQATNNVYYIDSFDNKNYEIQLNNKQIVLFENEKGQTLKHRTFQIATNTTVEIKIIQSGGRKGIELLVNAKGYSLDKYILLGYIRAEEKL